MIQQCNTPKLLPTISTIFVFSCITTLGMFLDMDKHHTGACSLITTMFIGKELYRQYSLENRLEKSLETLKEKEIEEEEVVNLIPPPKEELEDELKEEDDVKSPTKSWLNFFFKYEDDYDILQVDESLP